MKPFPLGCSQLPSGLFWQNLFLSPAVLISSGLILAGSLSVPRYPGIDGAYYGKILICAPMSCQRRGLLRQNLFLSPDVLPTTGLITAKSLSAPRCPANDGAYYGKIPFCAPISRYRRGLLRQNPYLRPDVLPTTGLITAKFLAAPRWSEIPRAYFDRISFCAPLVRDPRGLF